MAAAKPSRAKASARKWVVYRVSVLDFRNDYRAVSPRGYIGQSDRVEGQQRTAGGQRIHADVPFARFLEHLQARPWSDLIVGVPEVIGTYDSEADALAAEARAIAEHLPQYNVDGNPDHPDRVVPWAQQEMRAERDAARAAGGSIHDLGHRRYVTTPRTRPDTVKPAGRVNGHHHAAAVQTAPQQRAAAAAPARPPARAHRPVPVPAAAARPAPAAPMTAATLARSGAAGVAVFAGLWIGAARAADAAGVPLPAELAAPAAAFLATLTVAWHRLTR